MPNFASASLTSAIGKQDCGQMSALERIRYCNKQYQTIVVMGSYSDKRTLACLDKKRPKNLYNDETSYLEIKITWRY